MTDELRIYFGFRSPYSRLGLHKIARAGLPDLIPTRLFPFLAPAGGAPFFDPAASPPKLAYYAEDAARMTARLGLPVRLPDPFDADFDLANQTFLAADQAGAGLAFALAVSDARWGHGRNVSDPAVLKDCASEAGLAAELVEGAQLDPTPTETISDMIERDSVFGVPFAALEKDGRTHKFWGQDRFDLLIETLTGAS